MYKARGTPQSHFDNHDFDIARNGLIVSETELSNTKVCHARWLYA
jgi:hypothetical protein